MITPRMAAAAAAGLVLAACAEESAGVRPASTGVPPSTASASPSAAPSWAAPSTCSETKARPLTISGPREVGAGGHTDVNTVDFGRLHGKPNLRTGAPLGSLPGPTCPPTPTCANRPT
ncbi:hypothetical protein [Nonomuraea sp. NEAU-A123]|uniref:hypothetical protein n=1 Tax=Nonomuraea sp. NEAU-A123 TaxID=2839649 RepID=UPI001BE4A219|nr:hypothetical protein [Nonomuraea sp. NEAU-A123]MBT2225335.1 hypothetical protein [Nonomuraea sp. NEAU-A123]